MRISKHEAALMVRELENISSKLGRMGESVIDADPNLSESIFKIISNIMFDIEGPVITFYPSLRPVVMLGEKFKNSTYRIMCYDKKMNIENTVKTNIIPDNADSELNKMEEDFSQNPDLFFYMEIENLNTKSDSDKL